MHRFFVEESPHPDGSIEIRGQDAKHAVRVLRLTEGDAFVAVLKDRGQYLARIIEAEARHVRAVIERSVERVTEPRASVTLFQGLPKGDKMDLVVQRCTEVGVYSIVPVMTDRTVVVPDRDRMPARIQRWRRIATESSELAGRTHVPSVLEPVEFGDAIRRASQFDLRLMPWEEEQARSLRQVLCEWRESRNGSHTKYGAQVLVLIGPEGGFSKREVLEAQAQGIVPVTLGPRMMRTENAGAATLTAILYEFGDIG